jgi:hypothetical protein
MSAWRIGAETPTYSEGARLGRRGQPAPGATTGDLKSAVDRLTKWIPGDVLALYVASVTAFSTEANAQPSVPLLVVFVVVTPLFVVGSAFAARGSVGSVELLSAALAIGAFTIWSLTVPFSGWQRWNVVDDNQAAVAVAAALGGVLFGFLAEGLSKRAADNGTPPR